MLLPQNSWGDENLIEVLKKGGIAIMPTDTLYGIVGQADNVSTVNRIYNLKKRALEKPCIILIGDIDEIKNFSIILSEMQKNAIKNSSIPASFILDCMDEKFSYLHHGTNTLAFRLPAPEALRDLLLKTGPLIAPSANPEGLPPAQNIEEAKKYFGISVDLYVDGGNLSGRASKIIKLHKDGSMSIIRE